MNHQEEEELGRLLCVYDCVHFAQFTIITAKLLLLFSHSHLHSYLLIIFCILLPVVFLETRC